MKLHSTSVSHRAITLLLLAACWLPVEVRAEFDPRAHGDLNGVIMLCATEPGSPRFDAAWLAWVQENPEADFEGAITSVVTRAGTVRSMAVPGMAPARPTTRPDPGQVAEHMRRLTASSSSLLRQSQQQP